VRMVFPELAFDFEYFSESSLLAPNTEAADQKEFGLPCMGNCSLVHQPTLLSAFFRIIAARGKRHYYFVSPFFSRIILSVRFWKKKLLARGPFPMHCYRALLNLFTSFPSTCKLSYSAPAKQKWPCGRICSLLLESPRSSFSSA
jgi:hypothetical protein